MNAKRRSPNPSFSGANAERAFTKVILRLVKGGPERRAIEAGEIDALVDPVSGATLLLPEAQRVLIERQRRATFNDPDPRDLSTGGEPAVDSQDPFKNYRGIARYITGRKPRELLQLEYAVARCLADAVTATTALKAVIRTVCETQGWDYGRYYRLDPASGVLRFDESWGLPDTRMPPAVFVSGAGGDNAYVFPIMSDDKTFGVLAFSSHGILEPDDRMRQAALSIGSQLGRFLQRQQAADALRRSEARFRKLTELSSDWYWEQDSYFRFTQYVGRGVSSPGDVLGKTHWELPNIVLSDVEWAEHKWQLVARKSFRDFEFAAVLPDGRLGYYCISGEPVYDDAGAFTGYCGTGRDITKRTEIALQETEALLRAVAKLSSGC